MADELEKTPPDEPTPDEVPPPPPPAPAPTPDPEVAALRAQVSELTDTMRAMSGAGMGNRYQSAPQQDTGEIVPPAYAAVLRQQGFSDDEIQKNGAVIMPFLRTAAQEVLGVLVPINDRLNAIDAESDGETYPHMKLLKKEIRAVQTRAQKEGRFMDFNTAYHTAVSSHMSKIIDAEVKKRTGGAAPETQATARALDASTTTGIAGVQKAVRTAAKGPLTATDIASLPQEERDKVWAELENTPF